MIFFQIIKNIIVAKEWNFSKSFDAWALKKSLLKSYITKITPRGRSNDRARIWIRARSRSCALGRFRGASGRRRVDGRSGGRGRLQSCRNCRRERWQSGWVVGNESVVCARASDRRDTANVWRGVREGARCHDVRVSLRAASISSESASQPCPSLRNMARDSRRVVDDGGGGSGGGATVRCKLVLVFSVLLLAIVVPAAYADSQGESRRQFLIMHATCVPCYVRGCR